MNLKTRRIASLRWLAAFFLLATAAAYCARQAARAVSADAVVTGPAPAAQELFSLERRISVVAQRLNTIELTVNRIEQQTRYSSSVPPASQSVRDTELELLRSQVELLQRRVAHALARGRRDTELELLRSQVELLQRRVAEDE